MILEKLAWARLWWSLKAILKCLDWVLRAVRRHQRVLSKWGTWSACHFWRFTLVANVDGLKWGREQRQWVQEEADIESRWGMMVFWPTVREWEWRMSVGMEQCSPPRLFCLTGDMRQRFETVLVVTLESYYWHLVCRPQDVATHPIMLQDSPPEQRIICPRMSIVLK